LVDDTAAVNRIGTEHEKLGYYFDNTRRLEYETIKFLLENLCSRFGWDPVMEGEYIIGATFEDQSVSLEPGGQFELSGAPVDNLHKTCAEVSNHLYQVAQSSPSITNLNCGNGF
jgi:glutamate--cysteine ligase